MICIISPHSASHNFWPNLFLPCFELNVSRNDNIFTVSWLLITFINFSIIAASAEVYYFFSDVCETMLWMSYFCIIPRFDCWLLLLYLSIFLTLEACMYVCPFILGSNIYTRCLSISVLLTLEDFESASLISFTLDIYNSSWSCLIGASCSSLTRF